VSELHLAYSAWADGAQLPKTERMNAKRFGRAFAERYTRLGWPIQRTSVGGRTAYRGLRIIAGGRGAASQEPDGGDGGFQDQSAGAAYAARESRQTGESPAEPTKPTGAAPAGDRGPLDDVLWDEDLAERATDDEGEMFA
jgi:hypothetical protein